MATQLSQGDLWLSVPASQQVWLCHIKLFFAFLIKDTFTFKFSQIKCSYCLQQSWLFMEKITVNMSTGYIDP